MAGQWLFVLLDRKTFFYPIGGEGIGDGEDSEALEAHDAKGGESRAEIRAACEGTTATIDDEVGGARERLRPLLQVVEAGR